MKKIDRTHAALIAGLAIVLAVTIVVVATIAAAATVSGTSEIVDTVEPTTTTVEPTTTSTTIDLSFLNTTTTSTTVPEYRNTTPPAPPTDLPERWILLAQCEAGGRWDYPPISGGFSGGLMFHIGTWRANGGLDYAPDAYLATPEQQIEIATRVLEASGWGAWPACSKKLGFR